MSRLGLIVAAFVAGVFAVLQQAQAGEWVEVPALADDVNAGKLPPMAHATRPA